MYFRKVEFATLCVLSGVIQCLPTLKGKGALYVYMKVEKSTYTDKKETKFSSYIKEFRWDRVQVIYEEGLPNIYMRKCANFSPNMRRPLIIYDFAPDPSEFPYI
jgi:hypothetical protein